MVALGTFDGVHLGHQRVISAAAEIAEKENMPLLALTFSDHPRKVMGQPIKLICTPEEKIQLLKQAGADDVVALPFSKIRNLSPEAFIEFAVGYYGADWFVCGEDYRFGKNGAGDAPLLQKICARCGKNMKVVAFATDAFHQKISSRTIRTWIEQGNCEQVQATLGRPYSLEGTVVHGKGLAHKWGTPTLNIPIPAELETPRFGVYATIAQVDGVRYKAVTNVGIRPTFNDGSTPNMETYILDASFDAVAKARIFFVRYLRPERQFDDTKSLQLQIAKDVEKAKERVII